MPSSRRYRLAHMGGPNERRLARQIEQEGGQTLQASRALAALAEDEQIVIWSTDAAVDAIPL